MIDKRGTLKIHIATVKIEVHGRGNVVSLITNAISDAGLDMLSEPIYNNMMYQVGETIKVYEEEKGR